MSDNYIQGSSHELNYKTHEKKYASCKESKSDNYCYCKIERAISKWGAIEKSPI